MSDKYAIISFTILGKHCRKTLGKGIKTQSHKTTKG